MTNNDVLRRFRYALELDNLTLLAVFQLSGVKLAPERLASMLKSEEEVGFEAISDELLGRFFDGFITKQRGPRPGPPEVGSAASVDLNNNRVLRAIKIGLELRDVDMLAVMELAGTPISKTELSALFRREDHRNFQACGNQFLRNFLKGLALWHRGSLRPSHS
jgi:uncharacterized protein YehS (DUF1456 family)